MLSLLQHLILLLVYTERNMWPLLEQVLKNVGLFSVAAPTLLPPYLQPKALWDIKLLTQVVRGLYIGV